MVVTAEQHSDELAGLGIPQADCPVGGPAGQLLSVRRESEAADRIRMTPQNPEHPAGVDLPDPNRVVHAAAGRDRAVGMVRHDPDRVMVPAKDSDLAGSGSPVSLAIHDRDRRDPQHYWGKRGGGRGSHTRCCRAIGHRAFLWKRPRFPWLAKERRRYL